MKYIKIILLICGIFIFIYLTESVPYCYNYIPNNFVVDRDAIYTNDDVLELQKIDITLLNVNGNSMFPTIKNNSQCLCVSKEGYEINDIIFFLAKIDDNFQGIVHRIVFINDEDIYTKGDNNYLFDHKMKEENIVCYVPKVPRYKTLIKIN